MSTSMASSLDQLSFRHISGPSFAGRCFTAWRSKCLSVIHTLAVIYKNLLP